MIDRSTTLAGIPIGADHIAGLIRGLEAALEDESTGLLDRDPPLPGHGPLEDRHQLALQRAVVGGGPAAQY